METKRTWLESALRSEAAFRTLGPPTGAQRWGCRFMLKPTSRGAYADRMLTDFVVVYVLRGSGLFIDASGKRHAVAAGDWLNHAPGHRYSLVPRTDGQWAEVYVAAPRWFDQVLGAAGCKVLEQPVWRCGLEPGLVERFERLRQSLRSADDVTLERLPAWLLELVLAARSSVHRGSADPQAGWVHEACRLLGGDWDRRTSLPRIAEVLGVSYERFRKLFAQRMGLSPREYRIRRRIDRARELIQQDGLSSKAVAYELGYADPFVFSKQFKSVVGISPAEFRKRMR